MSEFIHLCPTNLAAADQKPNCQASLVRDPGSTNQKRQLGQPMATRLLVNIKCKDDGQRKVIRENSEIFAKTSSPNKANDNEAKDGSEASSPMPSIIHFDLYNRRDGQLVRHLLTTSPMQNNSIGDLNLMADLGSEVSAETFASERLVLMSITDLENKHKQANITLLLNYDNQQPATVDKQAASSLKRAQQPAEGSAPTDRFARTSSNSSDAVGRSLINMHINRLRSR